VAATVTSRTAWAATRAAATATPAIAITIAATGTSFTRTFWTRSARFYRRDYSIHTVEVRLIIGIEVCAAFDHCRGGSLRRTVRC
jgi:hypothetical protein